jgi:antitoxin CptB
VLRRKIRFRAWHRGTSEADLLLGAFADQRLGAFAAEELYLFDRLLETDDPVIDDWIRGRRFIPKEHDNKVLASLRRYCLATQHCGGKDDQHNAEVDGSSPSLTTIRSQS